MTNESHVPASTSLEYSSEPQPHFRVLSEQMSRVLLVVRTLWYICGWIEVIHVGRRLAIIMDIATVKISNYLTYSERIHLLQHSNKVALCRELKWNGERTSTENITNLSSRVYSQALEGRWAKWNFSKNSSERDWHTNGDEMNAKKKGQVAQLLMLVASESTHSFLMNGEKCVWREGELFTILWCVSCRIAICMMGEGRDSWEWR